MSHRYGIDSLARRGNRFFGWGWFLADAAPTTSLELRVPLADGEEQVVSCAPGGLREDLSAAFPDMEHAIGGGFLMQGTLRGPVAAEPTRLCASLADGSLRESEIMGFPDALAANLAHDELQPWHRIPGTFALEWHRHGPRAAARWLKGQWRQWRGARETTTVLAELGTLASRDGGLAVVFDHAMGGGANRYGEQKVEQLRAEHGAVLLLRPRLASLQYQASLFIGERSRYALVDRLGDVLGALSGARGVHWHLNELVSFEDPPALLHWLVRQRGEDPDSQLSFYLHDFHAVCPAWTLIDAGGRFCAVPPLDACRQCLPRNQANTMSFPPQGIDIADWRAAWGRLLSSADRLVAFSQASVEVLRRAYPELDPARIVVQPHHVDATGLRPVALDAAASLVIGVVGHISRPKGAAIVLEMADLAQRSGGSPRFVVFGTLEGYAGQAGIDVVGEFERGALPGLLESHGVAACLLPSICSETFSYVTAELMLMEVPLAVFPIGAPAERVADYNRGMVLSRIDAGTALRELRAFADRTHGRRFC